MILLIFSQFFLAESLFFNNQYDLAMIEYKRLFFFDSISHKNLQLRLHYTITMLYKDFFSGYEETQKLLNDFPDIDSESRISLAEELINTENYSLAIDILKPISEDNLLRNRLIGYSYLFNHQYYNALREFKNIDKNLTTEIERYIKMPRKSVTRAMLLSVIFPGMGEIYAGDIKRGVQDFILTFLSGFLMYNSIKNKEYVDAGIIFSFAFNRFYFGSISNAGRIAYKMNEQSEKEFLEKIKVEYYQKDLGY